MSPETLDHVVMGALYEFCGELLAREEPITFSRRHSARPVVAVLREFMKKKGLDPAVTPMTGTWQHRCSGLHLKAAGEAADDTAVSEEPKNVAERRAVEGSEPDFLAQMAGGGLGSSESLAVGKEKT